MNITFSESLVAVALDTSLIIAVLVLILVFCAPLRRVRLFFSGLKLALLSWRGWHQPRGKVE